MMYLPREDVRVLLSTQLGGPAGPIPGRGGKTQAVLREQPVEYPVHDSCIKLTNQDALCEALVRRRFLLFTLLLAVAARLMGSGSSCWRADLCGIGGAVGLRRWAVILAPASRHSVFRALAVVPTTCCVAHRSVPPAPRIHPLSLWPQLRRHLLTSLLPRHVRHPQLRRRTLPTLPWRSLPTSWIRT